MIPLNAWSIIVVLTWWSSPRRISRSCGCSERFMPCASTQLTHNKRVSIAVVRVTRRGVCCRMSVSLASVLVMVLGIMPASFAPRGATTTNVPFVRTSATSPVLCHGEIRVSLCPVFDTVYPRTYTSPMGSSQPSARKRSMASACALTAGESCTSFSSSETDGGPTEAGRHRAESSRRSCGANTCRSYILDVQTGAVTMLDIPCDSRRRGT